MSSHLHRILQCSQGACDDDGTFEDEGCRGIVTGPIAGQDTLIVASIKSHIADKDALERWVCSVVSKTDIWRGGCACPQVMRAP